jgi:hypothetical protein
MAWIPGFRHPRCFGEPGRAMDRTLPICFSAPLPTWTGFSRARSPTMYRDMVMTYWLEKAEAEMRELG